jgi:hypothetical protein
MERGMDRLGGARSYFAPCEKPPTLRSQRFSSESVEVVVVLPVGHENFGRGIDGAVVAGGVTVGRVRPGIETPGSGLEVPAMVGGVAAAVEVGASVDPVGDVVDDVVVVVAGRGTKPGEVDDPPPPMVAGCETPGVVAWCVGVLTGKLWDATRLTDAAAAADRARVEVLKAAIQRTDRRELGDRGRSVRGGGAWAGVSKAPDEMAALATTGEDHSWSGRILNRRTCQSRLARASTIDRRSRRAKRPQAMPDWSSISAVPLNCSEPGWCHRS